MSARLPKVGSDTGTWGTILNTFLEVAHNTNGTLKISAITAAGGGTYSKPSGGIPASDLASAVQTELTKASSSVQLGGDLSGTNTAPIVSKLQGTGVNASGPTNGQVLTYNSTANQWVPATVSSTTVSDATNSSKGIVELAGDLGGTASSPTVTATHLASALPVNQGGTGATSQNFVDLTSTQTVAGSKTFSSTITGNISGNAATVTTNANLTGDVTSSGNATTVAKLNGVNVPGSAPTNGQVLTATSGSASAWSTPVSGVSLDSTGSDIQPLGSQAAGSSSMAAKADHVHAMPRLDQVNNPTASVSLNSQKLTNVASGSAASDAAVIGQVQQVFSPLAYGAVGNGTTDDTAALTACVAAAVAAKGIIDLGSNTYKTSSPITISTSFYMRGAGYNGGAITNSASDVFAIASVASEVIIENCTFVASGGHVFNASNAPGMSFWNILGVQINQTNPSFAIWYQIGGGWIDCLVDQNCFFQCSGSATVSPWSVLRAPGAYNSVKFSRGRFLANNATVPFFTIDPGFGAHTDTNVGMTASSHTVTDTSAVSADLGLFVYSSNFSGGSSLITAVTPGTGYTVATAATANLSGQTCLIGTIGWDEDIIFDHITWEECKGGAIWMSGSVDILINMCAYWDTTAIADIYHFEKSLTGYPCRNIIVRGGRGGAGSGGVNNFFADSNCTNILIDSFGQGWAGPPVISSPAAQTTIVNPTTSGTSPLVTAPGFNTVGINAAVNAGTRLIGATVSGAPTGSSNTYLTGDVVVDQTGTMWVCTSGGAPGNWSSSGTTATNIQWFTANGTWTKPTGAQSVEVMTLAGGAGGSSGSRGISTNVRCGGGGGGGGGLMFRTFAAADLTNTVNVTIGTGGTGGAAVTTDSTNGSPGTNGTQSFFGTYMQSYVSLAATAGGTQQVGNGTGLGGGTEAAMAPGGTGAPASVSGGSGAGPNLSSGANGGGSGGGITSSNVPSNGGNSNPSLLGSTGNIGVGGTVDTTPPTAGTQPTVKGTPSTGGGGGASSITTAAQAGATAFYGGGGGGGGASLNGNNSGAGGNGGPGFMLVITHFS